jgi:phosphatidylserine decarboxylase
MEHLEFVAYLTIAGLVVCSIIMSIKNNKDVDYTDKPVIDKDEYKDFSHTDDL